jgi:hypothetical protein
MSNKIRDLENQLRIAKAKVPISCKRCHDSIKREGDYYNPLNALEVTLSGGYAMFVDEPAWTFLLCRICCIELCEFLGLNVPVENWGQ